jgi:hypothetical protein
MLLRVLAVVTGAFGALFPRRVVETARNAALGACYENPEDLEPADWYVEATRVQSVLVAVAGVVAVLLSFVDRDRDESASDTET